MSAAVIAFKAVDNAAVGAYMADREKAHDEWWAKVRAFGERIGHPKVSIRSGMFGSHVVGYVPGEGEAPLEGWRVHKDWGVCVPSLRSRAGKDAEAELNTLSWRPPAMIGAEDHLHSPADGGGFSTYLLAPSVRQGRDGDWFLSFSRMPFDDELHKVDGSVWAPTRLSEFYAQTEEASGE